MIVWFMLSGCWVGVFDGGLDWIIPNYPYMASCGQHPQATLSKTMSDFFCDSVVSTKTHKTRIYTMKLKERNKCRSCH
jgi:hypothetical protein